MRLDKVDNHSNSLPTGPATAAAPAPRPAEGGLTPRQARALKHFLLPIIVVVLFLGAWQLLVQHFDIQRTLLPTPGYIYSRLMQALPALLSNAVPTTVETIVSFLIATAGGIVLAVLLTYSSTLNAAFYPIIVFFQLVPKVALAPLFVVWMGIGAGTRIEFAAFMAFFPMVISTMAGLRSTPKDVLRLCQGLTATPWQMFFLVRLPYAVPYLFSGMKIAITLAMIGVIVAEFISAQKGLGYLIVFASSQADTALILAAILILCIIGLALYGLVAIGEWLATRRYG